MKKMMALIGLCLTSCQWDGRGQCYPDDVIYYAVPTLIFLDVRNVVDRPENRYPVVHGVSSSLPASSSYYTLDFSSVLQYPSSECADLHGLRGKAALEVNYHTADFFTVFDGQVAQRQSRAFTIQFLDQKQARIIGLPRQDSCTEVEKRAYADTSLRDLVQRVQERGAEMNFVCFHSNSDTLIANYEFLSKDTVYKIQWPDPTCSSNAIDGSLLRFKVPSRGIAFDLSFYPCS